MSLSSEDRALIKYAIRVQEAASRRLDAIAETLKEILQELRRGKAGD